MAKYHLDHIKNKYGWTGKKYRALMGEIIANNSENVSKAVGRITKDGWQKGLKKITTKEARFTMPDVADVLPKKSIFIRKGAERGKLLTDTLRDKLTKDLRDALKETTAAGLPKYITHGGKNASRINPKLIKQFEDNLKDTFSGYLKKDPELGGIPRNIHTIAVTEMRSAVNDMKNSYAQKLADKNPDIEIRKVWIHNTHLSKSRKFIRQGHLSLNRSSVPMNAAFAVVNDQTGAVNQMMHPHDPNSPAEQVIGCHCDVEYFARKKKKSEIASVQKAVVGMAPVMKSLLTGIVMKGTKAEIGETRTHADGTKWKKVAETGDHNVDWVQVTEGKYGKHFSAATGQFVETIKEKTQVDISKIDSMFEFEEGKQFTEILKKHKPKDELTTEFNEKLTAFRDKVFKGMGVHPEAKAQLDAMISSWTGSSNSLKSLAMTYGLVEAFKGFPGSELKQKFASQDEAEEARLQYLSQIVHGKSDKIEDYESKFKGALYAQFAFTHAILERKHPGQTSLKLYRSIGGQMGDIVSEMKGSGNGIGTFDVRPLSSWTTNYKKYNAGNTIQYELPFNTIFLTHYSNEKLSYGKHSSYDEEEHIPYGAYYKITKDNIVKSQYPLTGIPTVSKPDDLLPGENPKEKKPASSASIEGLSSSKYHKMSLQELQDSKHSSPATKKAYGKVKESLGKLCHETPPDKISPEFKSFFKETTGQDWDGLGDTKAGKDQKYAALKKIPSGSYIGFLETGLTPKQIEEKKKEKKAKGKVKVDEKLNSMTYDEINSLHENAKDPQEKKKILAYMANINKKTKELYSTPASALHPDFKKKVEDVSGKDWDDMTTNDKWAAMKKIKPGHIMNHSIGGLPEGSEPAQKPAQAPAAPKQPGKNGYGTKGKGKGDAIAGHGFIANHGKKTLLNYLAEKPLKGQAKITADKIHETIGSFVDSGHNHSQEFKDLIKKHTGKDWDSMSSFDKKAAIQNDIPMAHIISYASSGKPYKWKDEPAASQSAAQAPAQKPAEPKPAASNNSPHFGKASAASGDQHALINQGGLTLNEDSYKVLNDNLGGSTGAKEIKAPNGGTYIMKHGAHPDHVKEEYLASRIYGMHGNIKSPTTHLMDHVDKQGNHKAAILSEKVNGVEMGKLPPEQFEKAKKHAQKDFALDALMGHWDSAGLNHDNMLYDAKTDTLHRIDPGGALRYRAQGAPKGDKFGLKVGEIDSMRNPSVNSSAAKIFGDLSDDQVVSQIKELSQKMPKIIKTVEGMHGHDKTLSNLLQYRYNDMKKWANDRGANIE